MKILGIFLKLMFVAMCIWIFIFEAIWILVSVSNAQSIKQQVNHRPVRVRKELSAQDFYLFETSKILDEVNNYIGQSKENISVIFVGDLMLSRGVNDRMRSYNNYFYPFQELEGFLNNADLTFGNLESPILHGNYVPVNSFSFDAHPETANSMAKAGFDVLSMANNHAGNMGQAGFLKSFEKLNENGMYYVGAAKKKSDLDQQGVITEVEGVKIGWLAYAYGPSHYGTDGDYPGMALMDIEKMKQDVERLKKQTDHVFVSMHAGTEYTENISSQQRNFAQAAIDQGASLVIGHHPHVVQRIERYNNGFIMFSLGNFVFDQMWSQDTRRSLATKIYLDKEDINRFEYYPLKIYDYSQPRLAEGSDRKNIYNRLRTELNFEKAIFVNDNKIEFTDIAAQGLAEQIEEKVLAADINENKVPEYIYQRENKLYIIENNALVWQSFPDWNVKKVFLADANADNKTDINIILDKEDGNHWFIYGWRRDSWQPYWDSSEIFPAIIDIEEISPGKFLILEKENNKNNLTVWQWEEWGHKLVDEVKDVQIEKINRVGNGLFFIK